MSTINEALRATAEIRAQLDAAPRPQRRAPPTEMPEADRIAAGKARVLELLSQALETADGLMHGDNPAAANATCRFVLDMSLKGPFAVEKEPEDDLEYSRLKSMAQATIAELIGVERLSDPVLAAKRTAPTVRPEESDVDDATDTSTSGDADDGA